MDAVVGRFTRVLRALPRTTGTGVCPATGAAHRSATDESLFQLTEVPVAVVAMDKLDIYLCADCQGLFYTRTRDGEAT